MRIRVLQVLVLSLVSAAACVSCSSRRVADEGAPGPEEFRRMPDGKRWTTANLSVDAGTSYCYDDDELNCRRYGRLYPWEAAQEGCRSLGNGWRLPTNDEWRRLAGHYGGVSDESGDGGAMAYESLLDGGSSGFDALLGGGRAAHEGAYTRIEAHGFYWTASEGDSATAWFYNFGRGAGALHRHGDGDRERAFSVRCVRQLRGLVRRSEAVGDRARARRRFRVRGVSI